MNCLLPLFHFLLTSRQTALFRSTLCWMDNWIWGNFRTSAFSPSAMPIRRAFLGTAGNGRSCKKRRPLTGSKSIRLTSCTSHTSAVNCNISPAVHILIFFTFDLFYLSKVVSCCFFLPFWLFQLWRKFLITLSSSSSFLDRLSPGAIVSSSSSFHARPRSISAFRHHQGTKFTKHDSNKNIYSLFALLCMVNHSSIHSLSAASPLSLSVRFQRPREEDVMR